MNTQRVILITPGFTADEHDRNCLPTLQLFVLELLRQNVAVQIISLDYPFSEKPYQWHGATVYPCGGHNSRWLKPRTIRRAINHCYRLLEEGGPAVIHSFWLGWASGIGERVAKRTGMRHITTLMGQDVLPQNRHRFRFLTAERQKRLVVLSAFQNEVFEKNAGLRAGHVIPWGVCDAEIPKMLPEARPIDVLGIGSFIPLKNWELWLQTVALVAKERPDLRALLIGSGPEDAGLKRLADQLGLAEKVHFTGDLPRPEVLKIMPQAKLLLHTSNFESQGYVLSEAAMNGCRIVGTPVGIGPEMGDCADSATGLAAKVLTGLAEPFLAAPLTPFTMSDTVLTYLELYRAM